MKNKEKQNIRKECIRQLKQLGTLKSFDSIAHVYHGNVVDNPDDFYFNPYYEQAKGIYSVRGSAGFYATEEREFAESFADKRLEELVREKQDGEPFVKRNPQIHEILSENPEKLVFIYTVAGKYLNSIMRKKEQNFCAQFASTFSFNEIMPLRYDEFKNKEQILKLISVLCDENGIYKSSNDLIGSFPLYTDINNWKNSYENTTSDAKSKDAVRLIESIKELKDLTGIKDEKTILKFASYALAYRLFREGKWEPLAKLIVLPESDWSRFGVVTNQMLDDRAEFAKAIMQKCDIVGVNHVATQFIFWDNKSVNTKQFIEKQQQRNKYKYEQIEGLFDGCFTGKNFARLLGDFLPEETLGFFKGNVPAIKLACDDKNIEEYTETCLRVLDDSFKGEIPKKMMPVVKAIVVCCAVKKLDKTKTNRFGEIVAQMKKSCFLSKNAAKITDFLVNNAINFANDYYIKNDLTAIEKINQETNDLFLNLFHRKPTCEELVGIKSLASVLQTCSVGAQTTMGVTRDLKTGIFYFNNNESLTAKMKKPMDPAKRSQQLKVDEELDFEGLKEHLKNKKQNQKVNIKV